MFIILFVIVASFGATLAWFTDSIPAPQNLFEAGTVDISNGQEVVTPSEMGNVNPGDCFEKCFTINNNGTKAIELRMTDFAGVWSFDDSTTTLPLLYDDGPLYIAPHHDTDWKMRQVGDSFEFYYTAGPIDPGESVELCIIVAFDGPKMDYRYQGITLTLDGTFSAVQASNDAPVEVWNDADWASWKGENGWFSLSHYDGLAYFDAGQTVNMGTDYADYYETTKCFNGNGGNGGDPDPKLTIVKELLDEDGETVANSDVDFTATITGGTGAFESGQEFTFSVNSPKVLGPNDGLEFGVEYTVTEQEHSDYDLISIDPTTPFTLTAENNEVTVTIVNQEKETNGNGGNETAYGGDTEGATGTGWWYYFDTEGAQDQSVWAGQTNEIGTVTVLESSANDEVTITIDLSNGWKLQEGDDDAVKIQDYTRSDIPSSRPPSGQFEHKGTDLTVTVPKNDIYVIHLDVQEE